MNKEEKKVIKNLEKFAYSLDMGTISANEIKIVLNLIKKQEDEIKHLELDKQKLIKNIEEIKKKFGK